MSRKQTLKISAIVLSISLSGACGHSQQSVAQSVAPEIAGTRPFQDHAKQIVQSGLENLLKSGMTSEEAYEALHIKDPSDFHFAAGKLGRSLTFVFTSPLNTGVYCFLDFAWDESRQQWVLHRWIFRPKKGAETGEDWNGGELKRRRR